MTLQEIIMSSNLEDKEVDLLRNKFSSYEEIASEWEVKAKTIIVSRRDQTTEMEMAKTAAKKFQEMRLAVEEARKSLKEQSLRKGQAIDALAKYLQSLIAPIEKHLLTQANFIKLEDERIAKEKEMEELKKAEDEKIALEKKQREEQERIKLENEKLKAEMKEKEALIEKERIEALNKQKELQKALDETQEKEKAEKQKQQDQEKKAKDAAKNIVYQEWLQKNNFNEKTMKITIEGNRHILWQIISKIDVL